jgi:outer membrane protein assembly factor BamE (lipoprotein component of BamABCDE complex)
MPFRLARPLLLGAALLAGSAIVSGCTPVTAMNGFIAVDTQPTDIKVGADTRASVTSKLGSPSTVSAFDKNTWYYITQTSDKMAYLRPQLKSRKVVSISFDKDQKVTEVKALTLKDGYDLAYEQRETPTRGRELSWIEQVLGTIGRGSTGVLPQDMDPGNPRGGGAGGGQTGPH